MKRDLEQTYRDLRPYAFAIAYRMLGSVSEAEDTVQDAFLRLVQDHEPDIRSPKAYIATITTRLAIDRLRLARVRRETHVGPWLPEPVLDAQLSSLGPDASESVELADSLSMAFLVVLESLNPPERAVFLLHDVFGYEYDEIATMVEKSEANCRQLASRARRRVHAEQPRFTASREERDRLAGSFFAACQRGDMDGIVELLAGDAVLYGDGGARGAGINRPIHGRDGVAAMLGSWFRRLTQFGIRQVPVSVNGQPGAKFLDPEGRLVSIITLDILEGAVQTIRSVIDPDKLGHLGEVSPLGLRKQTTDGHSDAAWDSDR
jgi:RNA polymerase sigma-70 factor (ECF subfamily)